MSAIIAGRYRLLLPMLAIIADVGCCLLSPMSAVVALISVVISAMSPMSAIIADVCNWRCLHGEIDAAGHANALETPFLLSSDVIVADVELDERPVILWIAVNNSS
jgi:hypothetical protein